MNATVYILGIILQTVAAIIALIQVRRAPHKLPWLLIALSSLLIVARRAATLEQFLLAGRDLAAAEVLTLVISILFFLGVLLMTRMFREVSKNHEIMIETKESLSIMLQSIGDGVIATDVDGRVIQINKTAERLTGWSFADAYHRQFVDVFKIVNATTRATVPDPVRRVLETNDVIGLANQTALISRDGTEHHIADSAAPIRDSQGGVRGVIVVFSDVTEEHEAEKARQVALVKYKTLFDNFPLGITISDHAGNILETNPMADQILALSPADHLARTIDDPGWRIVRSDGTPMPTDEFASVRALKEHRGVNNVEMGIVKPDASTTWLNVTATPLPLDGHGVLVAYGDITERKQMHEALKERTHFMDRILWSTPNLVYIYDVNEGRNIYSNRMILDFLGYTAEQIKEFGSSLFERILHPDDAQRVAAHQARFVDAEENNILSVEYRMKHADGTWHWLHSLDVLFLRGAQNGALQILGSAEDITERKLAEEQVRSAHLKLEALWNIASQANADFKSLCDHILETIVRMTGSQFGFYGFVNEDESVMTIHTWSGEAMKACAMADKPAHFPIKDAGVWGEAVRHRKPFIMNDYASAHPAKKGYPSGHAPLTNLLVVPVFSNDKIISLAAVANRDEPYDDSDVSQLDAFMTGIQSIVERKRTEEQLRTSVAEREILLREVHHRVKNNLAAIIALIDMQHRSMEDPSTAAALVDLETRINTMALVHEHLYQAENVTQIDLHEYLSSLVSHLRASITIPDGLQCTVNAAGVTMGLDLAVPTGMVVNELVTNAMKYAFPSGTARDGSSPCEIIVSLTRSGRSFTLTVEDNGAGIPESFDLAAASSLGLRLVKMIGEHQLGGTVDVERSRGTRIVMTFETNEKK